MRHALLLEGTFGFQTGEDTIEGPTATLVFILRGLKHTFWNQGSHLTSVLTVVSPGEFERYFVELADSLAAVGEAPEAAMSLRTALPNATISRWLDRLDRPVYRG